MRQSRKLVKQTSGPHPKRVTRIPLKETELESSASHNSLPIRIGISRCLLGEAVRYDGGHKRDRFVTEVLSRHVEWVPICPEVEAGFGTPREAMRLVGDAKKPQLITVTTERNLTKPLTLYTGQKLETLAQEHLSCYIFKKDSPSCGIERVKLFNPQGMPSRAGVGLFARAFGERFPLVPIEDEGRLCDPVLPACILLPPVATTVAASLLAPIDCRLSHHP